MGLVSPFVFESLWEGVANSVIKHSVIYWRETIEKTYNFTNIFTSQNIMTARLYQIKEYFVNISCAKVLILS